jgi:hypothetical protein
MARTTAADHYAQGQRNEAFYHQIGGSGSSHPEWAMTALFYTAVHEIEAALLKLNAPPSKDHTDRKAGVRVRLSAAAPEYEQLFRLSMDARYGCVHHGAPVLQKAEQRLAAIRAVIASVAPPPY